MSEAVKPEQEEHRSLLGAALSIEYGPCSVAAAELARQAQTVGALQNTHTLARSSKPVAMKAQAPVKRSVSEQVLARRIERESSYSGGVEYTELPFSVVNEFTSTKKSVERTKRGLFRSHTATEEKVAYEYNSRWLGYRIAEGEVLLPIATFELRENGNCSYVQLGSEINDDSVFAVQGDEQTERLAIIEDLRKLVVETGSYPHHGQPEYTDRIKQFAKSECIRNAEYIVLALGDRIANRLSNLLAERGELKSAFLMGGDGKTTVYEQSKSIEISRSQVQDEIYTSTVRAVQPTDDAPITLGIFTRGNVGFPIAEFWPSTGESKIAGSYNLGAVDQYKSMMAIMTLLSYSQIVRKEFHELVGSEIAPDGYLHDTFMVRDMISQRLSPECEKQERLAQVIGSRATGVCFEGRVENVNMLTTRGSVSGHVEVNVVNDSVEARITAKPDALHGIQPSEIASFVYNPAQPIGEALPKGQDAEEFSTLIEGFRNHRTDKHT